MLARPMMQIGKSTAERINSNWLSLPMLLKQIIRYLPAQFLGPLALFVSMIVWTHYLAPMEMGTYALTTITQEVAFLLSLSWFSLYGLRYLPPKAHVNKRAQYLGTETTVFLLASLVHVLIAIGLLMMIRKGDMSWTIVLAVAGFFITRSSNTHLSERARADNHIPAYTILQTAGPLGGLLIGWALVVNWQQSAAAVLTGYTIAQTLGSVIGLGLMGFSFWPRRPNRRIIKLALTYGLPLLGLHVLAWCMEQNIRYIVEFANGAAAVGMLTVGWGLGRRASSFAAMLVAAAAFPLAVSLVKQNQWARAVEQLTLNHIYLVGLAAPLVVGMWYAGPVLIDLVIAEQYREMTKTILPLAILAGGLRDINIHSTAQLFILNRDFRVAAAVDIIDIVCSAVLTALGLWFYGLYGAAFGATIGAGIGCVAGIGLAHLWTQFTYPLLHALRIAAATALMAIVLHLMTFQPSWYGLASMVAVGMLSYALGIAIAYSGKLRMQKI